MIGSFYKNTRVPTKTIGMLVVLASLLSSVSFASAAQNGVAPITLLDETIKETGIPIHGVSADNGRITRIDFKPEATEEQKQQAWDIVRDFDYEKEIEKISKEAKGKNGEATASDGDSASLLGSIRDAFLDFGIMIKNGITYIANLAVETFSAKTARVERLEFVDKATGEIYCTWIENGETRKEKGECDGIFNDQLPIINENVSNENTSDEPVVEAEPVQEIESAPENQLAEELINENQQPAQEQLSEPEIIAEPELEQPVEVSEPAAVLEPSEPLPAEPEEPPQETVVEEPVVVVEPPIVEPEPPAPQPPVENLAQ